MKNPIKVRGKQSAVNLTLFFNRITCILKTSSEMKDLSYELAPQPPSMFHDGIMRKSNKSVLGSLLKSFAPI